MSDDGHNHAPSVMRKDNCPGCGTAQPLDDEGHVDYPHYPGRLYDCPACEARCHCTPGETECIFEGEHNGLAAQGSEGS